MKFGRYWWIIAFVAIAVGELLGTAARLFLPQPHFAPLLRYALYFGLCTVAALSAGRVIQRLVPGPITAPVLQKRQALSQAWMFFCIGFFLKLFT